MSNDWYVGDLGAQEYYEKRVNKVVTAIWHGASSTQEYMGTLHVDASSGIRLELTGPHFPRPHLVACLKCNAGRYGTLYAMQCKLRWRSSKGADVHVRTYDVHHVLSAKGDVNPMLLESPISETLVEVHGLSEWHLADSDVQALMQQKLQWYRSDLVLSHGIGVLLHAIGRTMLDYVKIPSFSVAPQSQLQLMLASARPLDDFVRMRRAVSMVLELATGSPAPCLSMEMTPPGHVKGGFVQRANVFAWSPDEAFNRPLVFIRRRDMLFTYSDIEPFKETIASEYVRWFKGDGSPEKRFLETILSTTRLTFSAIDQIRIFVDALATLADDQHENTGRDDKTFSAAREAVRSAAVHCAHETVSQYDFGDVPGTSVDDLKKRLHERIDASERAMFGSTQKEKILTLLRELPAAVLSDILHRKNLDDFVGKAVATRNTSTHPRSSSARARPFKDSELVKAASSLWLLGAFVAMRLAGFPASLLETLAKRQHDNPWFQKQMP